MEVREATEADTTHLHALLPELGYALSLEAFTRQFAMYRASESTRIFVSCQHSQSAPIGFLSAALIPLIHESGFFGRITALVVASEYRGKGCGSSLISAAEMWFLSKGCQRVEVTSGDARLQAHKLYEAHGFIRTSQRFLKRPAS